MAQFAVLPLDGRLVNGILLDLQTVIWEDRDDGQLKINEVNWEIVQFQGFAVLLFFKSIFLYLIKLYLAYKTFVIEQFH